jgi:hypothetical protein
MRNDTFYTAEEARKLGLVDKVLTPAPKLSAPTHKADEPAEKTKRSKNGLKRTPALKP